MWLRLFQGRLNRHGFTGQFGFTFVVSYSKFLYQNSISYSNLSFFYWILNNFSRTLNTTHPTIWIGWCDFLISEEKTGKKRKEKGLSYPRFCHLKSHGIVLKSNPFLTMRYEGHSHRSLLRSFLLTISNFFRRTSLVVSVTMLVTWAKRSSSESSTLLESSKLEAIACQRESKREWGATVRELVREQTRERERGEMA